jgi:hypothetical protein
MARRMSGDDLITALTEAPTEAAARTAADAAPAAALYAAADTLYVDSYGHGRAWLRSAVTREARA